MCYDWSGVKSIVHLSTNKLIKTNVMTVSSPLDRPTKRKYTPDNCYNARFELSPTSIRNEISPRVIKRLRPKPITSQCLRGYFPSSIILLTPSQNFIATISRATKLQSRGRDNDVQSRR